MSVLIAEKSDIIRTGIKYILHEFDKGLRVAEVLNEKKLLKKLNKESYSLVFVNPELLDDEFTFFDSIKVKNRPGFIAISSNTAYNNKFFEQIIELKAGKEKIFKIVQKFAKTNFKIQEGKKNDELSAREREIVSEIASGLTNKEIADKLFLSTHTVITHRKNITKKLGIKTTSGLTVYAIINNLIDIN